ncbi:5'-methylthioadenosine/S-adenosylhomocysteine nucleosidase [Subtercola sp. YIM 133946]|uniref:5'-methylthioadenosine/S-adenosylhomocysteine nucleosidase n=1 Tax=Subtercola sp. YIM 133946 TaxID=3118909 RepID=UPI002F947262
MQVDAVIITAMDDEAQPFIDRASVVGAATRVGHAVYRELTLAGHPVLLVRSGIGLVNAAGAATSAILATASGGIPGPIVISAGTAGGLGADVQVGDVVVGAEYVNVDADARVFGYILGQVPKMPALYRASDDHIAAAAALPAPAAPASAPSVPEARKPTPAPPAFAPTSAPRAPDSAVHTGMIVSSYSFVTSARAAEILGQFPPSLATDMESVAIAQTCHVFGRPFLSVRGISDLCTPAPTDFLTHVDDAADRSATVVLSLLDALTGATPAAPGLLRDPV